MKKTRMMSVLLSACMTAACAAGMSVSSGAEYLNVTQMDESELEGVTSVSELADALGIASVGADAAAEQINAYGYEKMYFIYGIDAPGDVAQGFVFEDGVLDEGFGANLTVQGLAVYMNDGYSVCYVSENDFDAHDLSYAYIEADTVNGEVVVSIGGETVPESEYHVIFFTYEEIDGGESLTRAGTDFPTQAGTYIAAIVANDGSEYTGENRSAPFTVEGAKEENPVTGAAEENPVTGAALPGLAVLAVSMGTAIAATKGRKEHK
ncbi:MAG: hypothetical protein IJT87_02865 [Ruminiclostridium sp.]|nr:hypothetical protein [Ruminiclostridium sp.]